MRKVKGANTQKKIINAAIICLSRHGLHQTTFQKIADESGVSQPLVMHYFAKKDDIFPVVWSHVYDEAVKKTTSRLKEHESAENKLKEYFHVSWRMFSDDSDLTKIYIQMFFLSAFDDQLKSTNSMVKRTAINRIAAIIIEGQKSGVFSKELNPFNLAKIIHVSLSGFILNYASEHPEHNYPTLIDDFFQLTLKFLK